MHIDLHLTWKDHINHISKKISKSVGIIYKSRFYLSSKTKLSLYYTFIYPFITNCNTVWSSTYITNLNRIYYLQKRAVRTITNSGFRAHTCSTYIFDIRHIRYFQINSLYIARFASVIIRKFYYQYFIIYFYVAIRYIIIILDGPKIIVLTLSVPI